MRKVELSLKEKQKYEIIKKLIETNGNKERARIKLGLKSIRQINRLIAGYKEFGKEFFIHGNRGRKPKHALTDEFKNEIETLYTSKYFDCTYTQFAEDNTFTQFAYACSQLGTSIECSSVPEFKPRIERLFESFQLRLIPELRLANVTTIEEANAFLPAFLDKYNSKFALCIDNTKSVFEKQPSLQKIICNCRR